MKNTVSGFFSADKRVSTSTSQREPKYPDLKLGTPKK